MTTKKQKLIPVEAPWRLDPATPFLQLKAAESSNAAAVVVESYAQFYDKRDASTGYGGAGVQVINPPKFDDSGFAPVDEFYRRIRISFSRGLWSRLYPTFSDSEPIDPDAYDFSATGLYGITVQNMDEMFEAFFQAWEASGLCPDPGMYEVESSNWLKELREVPERCKHYILLGHDAYVEVIAEGWGWGIIE